jgi:hypothetical protein
MFVLSLSWQNDRFYIQMAQKKIRFSQELYEIVEHFGRRQQLFNIHFRNVKGGKTTKIGLFPSTFHRRYLKNDRFTKTGSGQS